MRIISLLFIFSLLFLNYVNAGDELSIHEKEQQARAFHRMFFIEEGRSTLNAEFTDYFYDNTLNLECYYQGLRDPDRHEKRFTKARIDQNPSFFWDELSKLTWLRTLNLSGALNGELPSSISSLLHLTSLDLSHNALRTLPSSMRELLPHCQVNLEDNPLLEHGEDECTWGHRELRAHFGHNAQLSPSLSDAAERTVPINYGLRALDLRHSASAKQCINTDPASFWKKITQFKQLSRLNLSKMLNGEVSASIGSFSELTFLDLSYNRLKTLPSSIGALSNQCRLILDGNYSLQQRGGDENTWGRTELEAYFGSNVSFF